MSCCLGCLSLIVTVVVGACAIIFGLFKWLFEVLREAPVEIYYVCGGLILLSFVWALLNQAVENLRKKSSPPRLIVPSRKLTKRERRAEARAKAEAQKAAEAAAAAEKAKTVALLVAPVSSFRPEIASVSPFVKKLVDKYGRVIFDRSNKALLEESLVLDDSLCSKRLQLLTTLDIPQNLFECKHSSDSRRQEVYRECLASLYQMYEINEGNGKILLNEVCGLLDFDIQT